MEFYINEEVLAFLAIMVLFYVVTYYTNKHEDERLRKQEVERLSALNKEEYAAELKKRKENHDLMNGVGRYPN